MAVDTKEELARTKSDYEFKVAMLEKQLKDSKLDDAMKRKVQEDFDELSQVLVV